MAELGGSSALCDFSRKKTYQSRTRLPGCEIASRSLADFELREQKRREEAGLSWVLEVQPAVSSLRPGVIK
jgi:hypothetical protein